MERFELAQAVSQVATLTGRFELRSGAVAETYFDKYQFESDPTLLAAIAEHLAPLLPETAEVLAGLELGGVPIATALSLQTGLPAAFVRKQAKRYGTARLVEGPDLLGREIVLVEDVVSSGGALLAAVDGLASIGINPTVAVCVIDRETGGLEALRERGVELRSLFRTRDLVAS